VRIDKDITLPDDLVRAAQDGRLLVFAGAGVSIPAPSNLPGFQELADRIGEGGSRRLPNEPFDRYLGRLEQDHVAVQKRARDLLDPPGSAPSTTHRAVVDLFSRPADVRLVTTNFDRHFTTSIRERFHDEVEIYCGPALPIGSEFDGLVYLHGAVGKPRSRLILTEADFGRAYLVQGWATRFLKEAFAAYTVLFLGYSHDDRIMDFLAQGLPPGTRRFVLKENGESDDWERRGIEVVQYPQTEGDPHARLAPVLQAWSRRMQMGALEHEQRIRDIVSVPPGPDVEDLDYLAESCRDEARLPYFTRHATRPEWLAWAEKIGLLDPLFTPGSQEEAPRAEVLSNWIADRFSVRHARQCLETMSKNSRDWPSVLWERIAFALSMVEERPSSDVLSRWVTLLYRAWRPWRGQRTLPMLLERCQFPQDIDAAVLLIELVTRIRTSIDRSGWWSDDEDQDQSGVRRIHLDPDLLGESYSVEEAWGAVRDEILARRGRFMIGLIEQRFESVLTLLRASGTASGGFDPISFGRSSIAPHEQDRGMEKISALIDIGRDVVEWAAGSDSELVQEVITRWSSSDSQLLRRLALHALAKVTKTTPESALEFLISNDLLYEFGVKKEVFAVLAARFGPSASEARARFIEYSMTTPAVPRREDDVDEEVAAQEAYARFNVAVWLARVAPESEEATVHLRSLEGLHPDFKARPHPDFDHWIEAGWGEPRAGEAEAQREGTELRSRPIESVVSELIDSESAVGEDEGRVRHRRAVAMALGQDKNWALRLAKELSRRKVKSADFWSRILQVIAGGAVDDLDWHELLVVITDADLGREVAKQVADLLVKGVESSSIGTEDFDQVYVLSERLWVACEDEPMGDTPRSDFGGWLFLAINRTAGSVAELWLRLIESERRAAGESWSGLSEGRRRLLLLCVEGESDSAGLARSILCSRLQFMYAIDANWTTAHLLPDFDWGRNELRATQAWHGFLHYGRFSAAFAPALLAQAGECAKRLAGPLSGMSENLTGRLAAAAVLFDEDPLQDGWLREFVKAAKGPCLREWTAHVGDVLKAADADVRRAAWHRWLGKYWEGRLDGVPMPITEEESEMLARWAIVLGADVPAAFDLAVKTPFTMGEHSDLLYRFGKYPLLESHPVEMTRLLRHLLRGARSVQFLGDRVLAAARKLLNEGGEKDDLLAICDRLGALAVPAALGFREEVHQHFEQE